LHLRSVNVWLVVLDEFSQNLVKRCVGIRILKWIDLRLEFLFLLVQLLFWKTFELEKRIR
jgi:hypothetical protein